MKKNYLLALICCCFSLSVSAGVPPTNLSSTQNQHVTQLDAYLFPTRNIDYLLTGRVSSDFYENFVYSYDAADRLICILESSDVQLRDSLTYNSENQVSRIDGYQLINQSWAHVYYVEYTYDESGNRISRTNYNNFGGNFVLGGIYQYSYNQNVLVSHSMYLGGLSSLFETCHYIRGNDGLLETELYLQGFDVMDSAVKISYYYNESRQLIRKYKYFYEEGWNEDGSEEFFYDNLGNCSEHNSKDNTGNYTERRLYEFNTTVSTDDVMLPNSSPELFIPEFFNDANMRVLEHWYTLDVDMILQYVCDYHYLYNGESVGVCDHSKQISGKIYPNPTDGVIYLKESDGSNNPVHVSVWDMQGRNVLSVDDMTATNAIDLSRCSPGIYVLRLSFPDGNIRYEKVIKK